MDAGKGTDTGGPRESARYSSTSRDGSHSDSCRDRHKVACVNGGRPAPVRYGNDAGPVGPAGVGRSGQCAVPRVVSGDRVKPWWPTGYTLQPWLGLHSVPEYGFTVGA